MLDRAFRAVLRDFTTYALIAAVVLFPLHLIYSFVFQDTIAVSSLHGEIGRLSADDTIRGVGSGDLTTYRIVGALLLLIEVLLLPLLVAAAAVALDHRERGELPTVRGSWGGVRSRERASVGTPRNSGVLLSAVAVALVVGLLARAGGLLLLEPLSDRTLWAGVAIVETVARSLAAPFVMVPAALLSRNG